MRRNRTIYGRKAITNGYEQGAHQTEDSNGNGTTYVPKTLEDQNGALKALNYLALVEKHTHNTGELFSI